MAKSWLERQTDKDLLFVLRDNYWGVKHWSEHTGGDVHIRVSSIIHSDNKFRDAFDELLGRMEKEQRDDNE